MEDDHYIQLQDFLKEALRSDLRAAAAHVEPEAEKARVLESSALARITGLCRANATERKPHYKEFIDQLREYPKKSFGFVLSSDYLAEADQIRKWLSEVRRGSAPNVGAAFIKYCWENLQPEVVELLTQLSPPSGSADEELVAKFLRQASAVPTSAAVSPETSGAAPEPRKPVDVFLIFSGGDRGTLVDGIATKLDLIDCRLRRFELTRTSTPNLGHHLRIGAKEAHLVVVFLTAAFLRRLDDEVTSAILQAVQDGDHFITVRDSLTESTVSSQLPALASLPALYAPVGLEKIAEGISRALSRIKLGSHGRFLHHEHFRKIHAGRVFLEDLLALRFIGRGAGRGSLAIIDIDRMKSINDRFGETVGDSVLVLVELIISDAIFGQCESGRCGDDTFYVVVYGQDQYQTFDMFENLRRTLDEYDWSQEAAGLWLTCSIGVVTYEGAEAGLDTTIRAAMGMINARKLGGNRVERGPLALPHSGIARSLRDYFS